MLYQPSVTKQPAERSADSRFNSSNLVYEFIEYKKINVDIITFG